MRTIHRTFAWLLVLLVLISLLCPALAFASEDSGSELESGAGTKEITGTAEDSGNTAASETAGNADATNTAASSGAAVSEKTELPGNVSQEDSDQQKQENPALGEKKEAQSDDSKERESAENESSADGTQAGGSGEKKSQEASLTKSAGEITGGSSSGSLSSADGTQKQSTKSRVMELFISAEGSDETGNGTHEAPFATLNAALAFAGDSDVEIILTLMTDLTLRETVPVVGNVVTVTGDDGGKKITRGEDFNAHFDPEEEHSTALFEVGTSDPESNPGGSLLIEGIVIDEAFMRTDPVQDAMIQVYDRGKLILGDDVYLLNYGGDSAVHGWPGSEVVVSDAAMILDQTAVEENGTVAVQHDEGCTYSQGAAAIVLSHGEKYEDVYGGQGDAGADVDKEDIKEANTDIDDKTISGVNTGNELKADGNTGSEGSGNDDKGKAAGDEGSDNKDTGVEDASSGNAGGESSGDEKTENKDSEGENTGDEKKSDVPSLKIQEKAASANGTLGAANDGGEALKAGNESSSSVSYTLTAPESVSQKSNERTINTYTSNTVAGYEIPYTVTLELGSFLGTAGAIAAQSLTGVDIELSLQLDALLYPETARAGENTVKLDWGYQFMNVSAIYSRGTGETGETTAVVTISLKADEESLKKADDLASVLSNPLSLTVNTVVPSSTAFPQKESVTGSLTLTTMTFTTGNGTWTPSVSPETKTATTKLLDANKTATLVYDPNGGTGGPGEQKLPAEKDHTLETENVPTHENVNGTKVLFCGWTAEKDQKIYSDGETAPVRLTSLTLEEGKDPYHVYAVYGYDRNGDGTADVDQKLLTLGFNGNAKSVTNVPGPITQLARPELMNTAEFDIPEQEPVRKYYTFLGWSKDENATEASYKYDDSRAAHRDITISENTELYAVWEASPVYTLYFDGNGGTNVPAAQSAPSDNGVANLTITKQIPTRTGRTFVGWATQRYGTAAFHPGEAVKLRGGDVTLYAVWERNSSWSGGAPKTGDESNVPLYVVLAVGSAGAAYVIYRVLKKRGDKR